MMLFALLLNGPSAISLYLSGVLQTVLLFFIGYNLYKTQWCLKVRGNFFIVALGLFFLLMSITSFILYIEDSIYFIRSFFIFSLSLLLANFFSKKYTFDFMSVFSNIILSLTVIGIIGLFVYQFMSSFDIIKIVGPREYHTNLLTVWITDSGYNSSMTSISPFQIRLQSFFDEPGTYGVFLSPVFIFFLLERKLFNVFLIGLGIFLSESLNAYLVTLFFVVVVIFFQARFLHKILLLLFILSVAFLSFEFLRPIFEIKFGLDAGYQTHSSFSVRFSEYEMVYRSLLSMPDFKSYSIVSSMEISSSYARWFMLSGVLFLFLFFFFILETSYQCFIVYKCRYFKRQALPIFLLSFSIFFSGFQRASILDNILYMSIFMSTSLLLRYIYILDKEMGFKYVVDK